MPHTDQHLIPAGEIWFLQSWKRYSWYTIVIYSRQEKWHCVNNLYFQVFVGERTAVLSERMRWVKISAAVNEERERGVSAKKPRVGISKGGTITNVGHTWHALKPLVMEQRGACQLIWIRKSIKGCFMAYFLESICVFTHFLPNENALESYGSQVQILY